MARNKLTLGQGHVRLRIIWPKTPDPRASPGPSLAQARFLEIWGPGNPEVWKSTNQTNENHKVHNIVGDTGYYFESFFFNFLDPNFPDFQTGPGPGLGRAWAGHGQGGSGWA